MKQKDAVVIEVDNVLGLRFNKYQTVALDALSSQELEIIKERITNSITAGHIDYSKDRTVFHEVRTYARSMVMNHLKKAKELNGNKNIGSTTISSSSHVSDPLPKQVRSNRLKGIDITVLTEDLKDFVMRKFA